ncbi:hypothetical protein KsCSTR_16470 [Candidatus Kuenenia stuttgartiensis]|uniref:Uncharacterized protein n=1 Tax=Kuenenia stuttgartiensis TaxID=174633 RepID=A0A6G7GNA8_KUEST|nr:hypothetical protein KsCSTR_16470 [Candidatus Kuenenia stuttgartiensis]
MLLLKFCHFNIPESFNLKEDIIIDIKANLKDDYRIPFTIYFTSLHVNC